MSILGTRVLRTEDPGFLTTGGVADLPPLSPPMPDLVDGRMARPLVARDVVRYVGELVAVVVTEDPYQG